jgi:hypothetical protein
MSHDWGRAFECLKLFSETGLALRSESASGDNFNIQNFSGELEFSVKFNPFYMKYLEIYGNQDPRELCIHHVSEIHSTHATKDIYINTHLWRFHLLSYNPVQFRNTIKITHKCAHWKVPVYKSMAPTLHITIYPCASTHSTWFH